MKINCRKDALISDDGLYRYWLTRNWQIGEDLNGGICWVMLNPSTADSNIDDPTIRRCIEFTSTFGYGKLTVVNLFAFRATDPKALNQARHPVGPDNDAHIVHAARQAALVVAGWGKSIPKAYAQRWRRVCELMFMENIRIHCLGKNGDGSPKHPLYVKGGTELMNL